MSKKICYITTVSSTLKTFVVPVVGYIKKNTDWDITFICSNDEKFANKLPEDVRYIPVSMKRGISLDGFRAVVNMIKIFKTEKFDLVQYSTPNASLYAAIASKIAGINIRLYCQWGMVFVGFKGVKKKFFRQIEKIVCSLSTHIEPDSFGNLDFCHSDGIYPNNKGSVVWYGSASGVNLSKFNINFKSNWRLDTRNKYNIQKNDFVYGFVGRITRDKGINELFKAFRKLLENNHVHLMLVGSMDKADSVCDELYEWAKAEPRVHFCGYTNVVEQYLSAMDVYVLPSYREGFGSAVVEAEAMGVPVIVTDIPGPTDAMIKDKTGLVVKKANVESLYDAMLKMYKDKELCKKFGLAGSSFVRERFEQNNLCEHIIKDRLSLMNTGKHFKDVK